MKARSLLPLVLVGLVGCGTPSLTGASLKATGHRALSRSPEAKWTILVHMAADNNLNRYGREDLNELEAGLSGQDVNVIVLYDGQMRGDSCIYQIKPDSGMNDKLVSETVDEGGAVIPATKEIDSGDSATLGKFVNWAAEKYPAQHTMLTIWNHGGGIFRKPDLAPVKAYAFDDRGTTMQTNDLSATILPAFKQASGKSLDILAFDACLMGQVEIGYQIRGLANILIASEDTEPGGGWDNKAWLSKLCQNPAMPSKSLSQTIVSEYGKSYLPGGSQDGVAPLGVTLSAVDIQLLDSSLMPALRRFGTVAAATLPAQQEAFLSLRLNAQDFNKAIAVDVGDLMQVIQSSPQMAPELKAASKEVQEALGKTVIANASTENKVKASGLSIYCPTGSKPYNVDYDNPSFIAFGQENWSQFIKAYKGV